MLFSREEWNKNITRLLLNFTLILKLKAILRRLENLKFCLVSGRFFKILCTSQKILTLLCEKVQIFVEKLYRREKQFFYQSNFNRTAIRYFGYRQLAYSLSATIRHNQLVWHGTCRVHPDLILAGDNLTITQTRYGHVGHTSTLCR